MIALFATFLKVLLDFLPDGRNDGNAHRITRHFVKPTVFQSGCLCFIELFIGKALQAPALNGHELSDSAFMPDTVPVLRCYGEHRLIGFFDSAPLLTNFFSVGRKDRSRFIRHKDSRMLASVIADSTVLPRCNASGSIGDDGIGIHINKIQTCFTAPTA